jgi:hypothetical protein
MGLQRLANLVLSSKPRYVTVDGLLVTDGVVKTSTGYTHASHGRVTAMVPHTFHDGLEEPVAERAAPWWKEEPALLEGEVAHMADAFPGFRVTSANGRPGWEGTINTGRGRFDVRLVHRPDHSIPRIEVVKPRRLERNAGRRTQRAPHVFDSGALCVASVQDWDPSRHDAVTAVAWTAHWLAVYSVWRTSGEKWPTQTDAA